MDSNFASSSNENGSSVSKDSSSQSFKELINDGRNSVSILCQRCPSVILRPRLAVHAQKQMCLPSMKLKSELGSNTIDGERLEDFWLVDNMYTFENVGFSNTVGTTKYLICADCEIGPIGWHDINNKSEFFVAMNRVRYE